MNIFKKTNEALCADGCDELNQIAIAINHHQAGEKNPWLAVPVKYRFKTDLKNNISKHKAPGFHVEITMTRIDEYGDPTCFNGKEYTSNYCLNRDTSIPSQATNIFISVKDDMVSLTMKGSMAPFSTFPLYPTGDINEQKFKTKKGCSVVVLSLNHDEVNAIIQEEIDKLSTGVQGDMVRYYKGKWIPSKYLAIWSILSEYRTCQKLNEVLKSKKSDMVWIPTNLRGESKKTKIGDLRGKFAMKEDGSYRKQCVNGKWVKMPLYVYMQRCGADLTMHRIGSERLSKDTYKDEAWLDVKLDHYAGKSNRISIETHLYKEGTGWEKTGWLWKRTNPGVPVYITYQVDDKLFTFRIEDLVKAVEADGPPEFEEFKNLQGKIFKKPKGNFHVNTSDDNDERTGAGKYGFYITLDKAATLASRTYDVLPSCLHDVALRADEYRTIEGEGIANTRDEWITRMVHLDTQQQRGA